MQKVNLNTTLGALILLLSNYAYAARDLVSASNSAVSTATNVAQALCTLGVISSAIVYQIPGAGQFAKGLLISGLIGGLCAFGGQSAITAISHIFS